MMTEFGKDLIGGLQEVLDHVEGKSTGARETVVMVEVPDEIDVLALRKRLRMSRVGFCGRYGFSVSTVEKWERRERRPDTAARAYLTVIEREPQAVNRALARAG